jgi:Domain of unknown function (DUF4157)
MRCFACQRAARSPEPDSAPAQSAPERARVPGLAPRPRLARPLPAHDIGRVPIADNPNRGRTAQLRAARQDAASVSVDRAPNRTGLPDALKAGVETLSGLSMDGVRVHYGSSEPAQIGALAYTRGRDIHLAPGQERHLPHEAWHAVQQARGTVQPTTSAAGVPINDDDSLEREADTMGSRAAQTEAAEEASDAPAIAAPSCACAAPPVAQRFLDIGDKRSTTEEKATLVAALKIDATAQSIAWKPAFETLLDTELASQKTRIYTDTAALLTDLVAVDGGGKWSAPEITLPRSETEARALRQSVKFNLTHTLNPSQPNPIATGFHTYLEDKLLKTPENIKIVRSHNHYLYFKEEGASNPADFQISTTGNPKAPGYIYTDEGQFAGNYDQYDTTEQWSDQTRSQSEREYMDLGAYKFKNHTVGHVSPFEHSPFVHDTAETTGTTTTYKNTDQFEGNVVIENPTLGQSVKAKQVEKPMMENKSHFFQFPIYSNTSPVIEAESGGKQLPKKRKRPEKLVFGRPDTTGTTEWAEFDNTGKTRYDTHEDVLEKTGQFEERNDPDWYKQDMPRKERIRKGMSSTGDIWDMAKKQKTVVPPLANVTTMPEDIISYDPDIETLKTDVPGYQSPPRTPFYMGPSDSVTISGQVTGHVIRGQTVTTIAGDTGVVTNVVSYDDTTGESTVELEIEIEPFQ